MTCDITCGSICVCKFSAMRAKFALLVFALISGTLLSGNMPVFASELGDAFAPMQESISDNPAGMYLMIACIVLLVTLVMSIFVGTIIYMQKSKSKKEKSPQSVDPES